MKEPKPLKAPKLAKVKKVVESDDDFWTDDDIEDDVEEIDTSTLVFTKIKDLKVGMEDVNVIATIDFVGDTSGKSYGDDPYAVGFIKDETGEIRLTFWGDDAKKAKAKKKIRIVKGWVSEYKGQLQVNPDRKIGIEFL